MYNSLVLPKCVSCKLFPLKKKTHLYLLQLTTLSQGLRAEKASRSDLETYVAVLNTQKAVMQADMDKIKLDLQEGECFLMYFVECSDFY